MLRNVAVIILQKDAISHVRLEISKYRWDIHLFFNVLRGSNSYRILFQNIIILLGICHLLPFCQIRAVSSGLLFIKFRETGKITYFEQDIVKSWFRKKTLKYK